MMFLPSATCRDVQWQVAWGCPSVLKLLQATDCCRLLYTVDGKNNPYEDPSEEVLNFESTVYNCHHPWTHSTAGACEVDLVSSSQVLRQTGGCSGFRLLKQWWANPTRAGNLSDLASG